MYYVSSIEGYDRQTDRQTGIQTDRDSETEGPIHFFVFLFLISVFNQLSNTGKLARIFMEGSRRRGRFSVVA